MKALKTFLVLETPEQVAQEAAQRFVALSLQAISYHGVFSVALAGGNTPRRMYELLATDLFKSRIEWPKVQVFFEDERCVSPDHPDSNYRLANEALISRVPIPATNVHPIVGEGDAKTNARLYETELKSFFAGQEWPRFDLVLLGLGEDGHTASLFPGSSALGERHAWVAAIWIEKLAAFRITLTPPAINNAANIIFLVTGAEKAATLASVISVPPGPERLPAQLIKPAAGTLIWLVDVQAASQLVD